MHLHYSGIGLSVKAKCPTFYWNRPARGGRRGSGNILVLTAGADHGIKAKTRRREKAARHKGYEDIIKI
jgi:hypothetical protein